jgi:hypothetical protein
MGSHPVRVLVRGLFVGRILSAVDAVLVARPPVSDLTSRPPAEQRAWLRIPAERQFWRTGARVGRCLYGSSNE